MLKKRNFANQNWFTFQNSLEFKIKDPISFKIQIKNESHNRENDDLLKAYVFMMFI